MPYIKPEERQKFQVCLDDIVDHIRTKGELTYCLYYLALKVMQSRGRSYTHISMAASAVHDAWAEFRRRHLDRYEDDKMHENGDIL